MEARRLAILCSHLNPSSPYPTRGSILGASDCTSGSSEDEKVESSNLQNDCVFCKIVRGESPCIKLYEDDMCLCILDTSPLIHGHSLIIPKLHYPTLEQTPPSVSSSSYLEQSPPRSMQVVAAMCSKVPLISNAIVKATDSDSFNLLVNNGAAAGQVIFHTHIHIIPRKKRDCLWASESLRRQTLKLDKEATQLALRVREQLCRVPEVHLVQPSS
ncbi:hypothetical protein IGI04_033236 [Brassica rapa subsp. trilocularis]|uniref:HIT domain-containing protein n=1 Tax=Brassica rapa subsp. trilocularis TaxID=1813537 RepID=A0ABQ7L594_BRACM|nr:hypothetical protein IGI04_033236 [Brassica rapa subsp. trilocularis]